MGRRFISWWLLLLSMGALGNAASGAESIETRRLDLSGRGPEATVEWAFRCLGEGRRCVDHEAPADAGWATLGVPSQWQQQGFGAYAYGHDEDKPDTVGEYRVPFTVPPSWADGRIDLVFEGVMTDTEAAIDGRSVGERHQGGFYRFTWDVTDHVRPGARQELTVRVAERSADRTVEKAERDADYWVFGGIYRPVWLRWRPASSIDYVAIDARHDGAFRARVRVHDSPPDSTVRLTVETMAGEAVGSASTAVDGAASDTIELAAAFTDVASWSAEAPHLHIARVELLHEGRTLHRVDERFGFRTLEVRNDASGRGLFVNGRRTLLRGVNRHAFWPTTGRAISDAMDRADVALMKAMNLNAVRASHYPPDRSFLDLCDEVGLYVIDELAGWHDAYSTKAGRPLVRSMVERDVNHPSILFWANGNEDGWNTALDDDFAIHDPQARPVLHTRSTFRGIDADHYADWAELDARLLPSSWFNRRRRAFGLSDEPLPLFLPTEILHGLYDGGSGAGLARYWERLRRHPRAMGLFLWAFTDEAIERADRSADDPERLDAAGNYAPDGVVGPFRESTANARALFEVFAPVVGELDIANAVVRFENRLDHTTLDRARVSWQVERITGDGFTEIAAGAVTPPTVEPGGRWVLPIEAPLRDADAVRVVVHGLPPLRGPGDPPLFDQRWPLIDSGRAARRLAASDDSVDPIELEVELEVELKVDSDAASFALVGADRRLELPLPVATGEDASTVIARRELVVDGRQVVELRFEGRLQRLRFEVFPTGWTRLAWTLDEDRDDGVPGIVLPMPETTVDRFAWLGHGPGRRWGNRLHGQWDLHDKRRANDVPLRWAHEPRFRGYYSVRRGVVFGPDGVWTVQVETPGVHVGLFAPRFPDNAKTAVAPVHAPDGIAFVHRVPEIGTKFASGAELAPAVDDPRGLYAGAVWIAPGDRLLPAVELQVDPEP